MPWRMPDVICGSAMAERQYPREQSHEFVLNENGTSTLRNTRSGQEMHSRIGPLAEAEQLYVGQSDLAQLLTNSSRAPAVIYDVGLGAATNALAAIETVSRLNTSRAIEIHSFESDLSGLELALSDPTRMPFVADRLVALRELLSHGRWTSASGSIRWRLHEGDFRESLARAPVADLVYYDFYAPKACPELWTVDVFDRVRACCASDALLITYCSATRVRAALLAAGFFVGLGASTAAKKETTLASPSSGRLATLLDSRWLEKLKASSEIDAAIATKVASHEQWTQLKPAMR